MAKKDGKGECWFTGIRNFKLSSMDKRIIHLLKDRPGLTNKEIYEQLETTQSHVSERLSRLKLKGAVRKEGTRKGRWYVTQPDRTLTQIETSSSYHADLKRDKVLKEIKEREVNMDEKKSTIDVIDKKEKRVIHWEPTDDYGLISRLKVFGGWLVKVDAEVVFVHDPKHKWEV